jgi:hypothetical protein
MRKTWLENKMARVVTLGAGVPEEDVVGKQDGVVRKGSRSGVPTQKVANKRRVIKNSVRLRPP